jgi:Uma2 family endonuclease
LWGYFKGNPIGETIGTVDCRLSEVTVRRPDVSIFLGERIRRIDRDAIPVPFGPDIAVEVLSPSDTAVGVRRKVRD